MNSAMADARSRRNEPERSKSQHRYGSGRWSERLSVGSRTMCPFHDLVVSHDLPSYREAQNALSSSVCHVGLGFSP